MKHHRINCNTISCSFQTQADIFCTNQTETRTDFSPQASEDWRESSYSGASVFASMTTVTNPSESRSGSVHGPRGSPRQRQPARWADRLPHRCEHLQPISGQSNLCVTVKGVMEDFFRLQTGSKSCFLMIHHLCAAQTNLTPVMFLPLNSIPRTHVWVPGSLKCLWHQFIVYKYELMRRFLFPFQWQALCCVLWPWSVLKQVKMNHGNKRGWNNG